MPWQPSTPPALVPFCQARIVRQTGGSFGSSRRCGRTRLGVSAESASPKSCKYTVSPRRGVRKTLPESRSTTGALLPTYAAAGRCGVIENPKRRKSVSRSGIGHVVARTRQGPKRSRGETDRRWRRAVVALFRGLARFDLRLWRTRKPARWTLDGRYCTMYHGDRCVHQKMFSSLTQFAATRAEVRQPENVQSRAARRPID